MDAAPEPLTTYTFGRFQVLPHRGQLLADGQPIKLGGRAFDILMALLETPGAVVDKDTLIGRVWPGRVVEENVLWVQMSALRAAFGAERDLIGTVAGRGYRFSGEISELSARAPVDPTLITESRSSDASATNLPLPIHPIIDRARELAELEDCLQRHRLVTVVGSGGVGKTRLAIELGRRVLPRYPDGVWLVDLATLSDPSLILTTTAAALGLSAGASDLTAEVLARRIGRRELLLIFDNCEHLIDAVAPLVEVLIFRAGRLTVIATSRESLRVGEEQIYALEPLSLAPVGAAEIDGYGAVTLFVERARLADRHFALTPENALSVAEVCRRLDGVPLALEMAAARTPLLGVEGLRSGLAERLGLLKQDARRSDGRHRSLRHVVAWSYNLLDEIDQKVFGRLAIFPGSFALDAAVAIVAPLGLDRWEAVDALWRLREKSLIVVEPDAAQRYRLLETLRLYAIEALRASGDSDAVAEQHARHFAEVLRRADAEWETVPDPDWVALYGPEIDNLRAALDWALGEPGRRQTALMLGPSLHLLFVLNLIAEGRRYGDQLVPLIDDDTPPPIAAALLYQTARFWHNSGNPRRLERSE